MDVLDGVQVLGRALGWVLTLWVVAIVRASDLGSFETMQLLSEVQHLREEVQRMKSSQLSAEQARPAPQSQPWQQGGMRPQQLHAQVAERLPGLQLLAASGQPQDRERRAGQPLAGRQDPEPSLDIQVVQQEIASIRNSLGQLSSRSPLLQGQTPSSAFAASDRCLGNPLFARLHGTLERLSLLEEDPVQVSYQIHAAWERDPGLFNVCPAGLISALVYLSMPQDEDWKYRLLHRATYLLYSTPGLAEELGARRWPMSDRLIRTMYQNSAVRNRLPLHRSEAVAQPWGQPGDADESAELAKRHHDSVSVHFASVLFYHFYNAESWPCACRTRSWCLPQWLRYLTNDTVDIWLAARDERKTLFRMGPGGCLRNVGHGLASHYFAEPFDLLFVFEINAFMHPLCRIVPARRALLYPTFELSDAQMLNFESLGVSVLPDDAMLKPPNPAMRRLLDEATSSRQARIRQPKGRLLIYPADIRPLKGQAEFLTALLLEQAPHPWSIRRLKGLTLVVAGGCDGNETYCSEVVSLSERVNADGIVNVVIADQLKDEDLAQVYAAALGTVLHSRVDCNPRAVYEGFVADAPFFTTERTRLPPLVQHLGHVSSGDAATLPQQLADFVGVCEAGGFAGRSRAFARRHLVEADVYRDVVQWMELKYTTGKGPEPIIRTEDALAGPLAGLGSLFGAGVGGTPLGSVPLTPGRAGSHG